MPKIPSEVKKIKKICLEALDDMKAQDVSEIDIDTSLKRILKSRLILFCAIIFAHCSPKPP